MNWKLKSRSSSNREDTAVDRFRNDPRFAAEYMNATIEDSDQGE